MIPGPPRTGECHALVVDDDQWVADSYGRILESVGFTVHLARDGASAERRLNEQQFDIVLSDIDMPGRTGLDLLRTVQALHADVPVLLVTGNADLDSAVQAVQLGALRYMVKPVDAQELAEAARDALKRHKLAAIKRRALELYGRAAEQTLSKNALALHLTQALDTLYMVYQPVVDSATHDVFGYEALLRCNDETLRRPDQLLEVAEDLGRTRDVGRAVRAKVAAMLATQERAPTVFVNLHPNDLHDDELYSKQSALARFAGQVVLEITERASIIGLADLNDRLTELRLLGYRIALDDLGAGYAGLSAFVQTRPDVVKIDMSLVRGVDSDVTKHKLVGSIARVCRELGVRVVGEGVETPAERDALVQLGCDLLQGYLFAKPAWPIPSVRW
jgi:EAL domain-containing protein (putative c-di-GMP-specific phosphodiesterase class I)